MRNKRTFISDNFFANPQDFTFGKTKKKSCATTVLYIIHECVLFSLCITFFFLHIFVIQIVLHHYQFWRNTKNVVEGIPNHKWRWNNVVHTYIPPPITCRIFSHGIIEDDEECNKIIYRVLCVRNIRTFLCFHSQISFNFYSAFDRMSRFVLPTKKRSV